MKKRLLIIGEVVLEKDILALESAGFEVGITPNYSQGLEWLDKSSPDLVIIDEVLPVVSGWEACSRLRQISDVPIILLGDDRSGRVIAKAINQGADAYMLKPFSTDELIAKIKALLRRCQRQER